MHRLVKRNGSEISVSALSELSAYGPLMARILFRRGIGTAEAAEKFLHPSLNDQHSPFLFRDMEKAVGILQNAKRKNERVCVYGDYDADGVCATALLYSALEEYGLSVGRYTPERCEGYGLNENAVRKIAEGYQVLVTVDLGITNHSEVRLARELGMTVIVTDHHSLDNEESPADAVLNPRLPGYPFEGLCGTGVAFKLVQALGFSQEDYLQWIDLVAVATVADIVPLMDENRIFTAIGLQRIRENPCKGIAALLKVCKGDKICSDTLGFQIGPRLNAAGRVGSPKIAVDLLLSRDERVASRNAAILNELNGQRQDGQQKIVNAALEAAASHDFTDEPMLMVYGKNWEKGLVGLAAGSLNQKYGCPAAVFSLDTETQLLTGSFRGITTTDISACLLASKDLSVRSGGHKMAGGATVSMENYSAFRQRIQEEIRKTPLKELVPELEYEDEIDFHELSLSLVDSLSLLEPFGCENPSPVFLCREATVEGGRYRAVGRDLNHLKLTICKDGIFADAIAFGFGSMAAQMPDSVDALYSVERNVFHDQENLQLNIHSIWPHDGKLISSTLSRMPSREKLLSMLAGLYGWKKAVPKEQYLNRIQTEEETQAHRKLLSAADSWERGHLLVTRCPLTAQYYQELLGADHLHIAAGESNEPLCLTTLLLFPCIDAKNNLFAEEGKLWHHVWLLDGECVDGEAALWASRLPKAIIHVLPLPDKPYDTLQSLCVSSAEQAETIASVRVAD